MFESKWEIIEENFGNETLMQRVLKARPEIQKALYGSDTTAFHDPFLINEMAEAVQCIISHLNRGSRIFIHGDYDADGLTSSYMIFDFLLYLGVNADIIVPNRFSDGYGLSMQNAEYLVETRCDLLITTDCGITAFEEVEYLMSSGVDVIITDHHEAKGRLPKASAVICCTRKDNSYPFSGLSGAGVAFKLIHGLCEKLGLQEKYLDYLIPCTIGTIADIVPLVDENRIFAKMGLKLLEESRNNVFKDILESSGYDSKGISARDVGFGIGPRLNAAGRMDDAGFIIKLLMNNNPIERQFLVNKLNSLNEERKQVQQKDFDRIYRYLFNTQKHLKESVIVVSLNGLHKGVLGIVASKLVDVFKRPVIVMNCENGLCEGSGRSVPNFNLIEALDECRELLNAYGGHAGAAGLSLNEANLDAFREKLNYTYASAGIQGMPLRIDSRCRAGEIRIDCIQELEVLGPFGNKNEKPVFVIENVEIKEKRIIGKSQNHMKLRIESQGHILQCLAFFSKEYEHLITEGQRYDIAFEVMINEYMGTSTPQINLVDIKISGTSESCRKIALFTLIDLIRKNNKKVDYYMLSEKLIGIGMPETAGDILSGKLGFSIGREDLAELYRRIAKNFSSGEIVSISDCSVMEIAAIEVLREIGVFQIDRTALFSYDIININKDIRTKPEKSRLYRILSE